MVIARIRWFLLLALLGACAQRIPLHPSRLQSFAPWTDVSPEHRLAAGDEIELKFLFNTELNDRLTVGPDGRVTAPLQGPVLAEGLTVPAFTHKLEQGYASTLRVPELGVIMRGYGSERIFVGGEVKQPGVLPMTGRIDVLQGILLAGGILPTARVGQIAVIRRDNANRPMLRTIDLRALIGRPDTMNSADNDFPLQAGDVIYVTRSDIADLDLFVDQYLDQAVPFSKNLNANLFNTTAPR